MSTLNQNAASKARVLGFHVAQELTPQELAQISGGRRPDNPRPQTWIDGSGWREDEID